MRTERAEGIFRNSVGSEQLRRKCCSSLAHACFFQVHKFPEVGIDVIASEATHVIVLPKTTAPLFAADILKGFVVLSGHEWDKEKMPSRGPQRPVQMEKRVSDIAAHMFEYVRMHYYVVIIAWKIIQIAEIYSRDISCEGVSGWTDVTHMVVIAPNCFQDPFIDASFRRDMEHAGVRAQRSELVEAQPQESRALGGIAGFAPNLGAAVEIEKFVATAKIANHEKLPEMEMWRFGGPAENAH